MLRRTRPAAEGTGLADCEATGAEGALNANVGPVPSPGDKRPQTEALKSCLERTSASMIQPVKMFSPESLQVNLFVSWPSRSTATRW